MNKYNKSNSPETVPWPNSNKNNIKVIKRSLNLNSNLRKYYMRTNR